MLMKPKKPCPLPATESEPHPGEFAIGSDKSRAAARMLASRKENSEQYSEANLFRGWTAASALFIDVRQKSLNQARAARRRNHANNPLPRSIIVLVAGSGVVPPPRVGDAPMTFQLIDSLPSDEPLMKS